MVPSAFIIGDTHFKSSLKGTSYDDFLDFIEKITAIAKRKKPDFIVLLGDILDSHEIKIPACKLAEKFIENLSNIAPTYILIGNHDYINNSQFLTDNHIFTPYKKWKNVYVADKAPLVLELGDDLDSKMFIFCPYTPPGKFIEALDKLTELGHNWEFADCIFAHQEFKGSSLSGNIISTKGDIWDEDYPIVISGHIHEESTIGKNIFYTGSSTQPSFADSADKKVWFVKWNDDGFDIEKIKVDIRKKKELMMTLDQLLNKEGCNSFIEDLKKYSVKITIERSAEEIKICSKSRFIKLLKDKYNVIIDYILKEDNVPEMNPVKSVSYRKIFHENVINLAEEARLEYELLFGRNIEDCSSSYDGEIELVFEGYT